MEAKPTTRGNHRSPTVLAEAVQAGDRRALARAITLVESTRPTDRPAAAALMNHVMSSTGGALRLGISGAPGVGKSTLIEALGLHLIDRGHKIAVLAIDPSSQRSGGSILGDKTRMESLAGDQGAFVRPSPTAGTLGGIARQTRSALLLCEAAGFDVILVETVGVGQSETAVAGIVDMLVMLLPPGGGDELQGLKKGIVELADLLVVNKADGDLKSAAGRTAAEYAAALHLLRPATPAWRPVVRICSALNNEGIAELWQLAEDFRTAVAEDGSLQRRRQGQAEQAMWEEVEDRLRARLRIDPAAEDVVQEVAAGRMSTIAAAEELLGRFLAMKDKS